MINLAQAKAQIDKILRKSRVHFYKPLQVAEILHRHRTKLAKFSLDDLNFYRTRSKPWRDELSKRLVGRVSTSSARFQDNLFEPNACPPAVIEALGKFNEKEGNEGAVETYIYLMMRDKFNDIVEARNFLLVKGTKLDIEGFIGLFERKPGLKRSVDKAYEICVYALFSVIVRLLKVELTMRYDSSNKQAITDFKGFISSVLGINGSDGEIHFPAQLHRVGVTNAADRGLDMFTNFGIAVQIKHMSLTEELAEDVTDSVTADDIVIVCKDAEEKLMNQACVVASRLWSKNTRNHYL